MTTRVDVEEMEITRSEKLLTVVLSVCKSSLRPALGLPVLATMSVLQSPRDDVSDVYPYHDTLAAVLL